jgi:phage I-like protein
MLSKLFICSGESVEVSGAPSEVKILPMGHVKSQKGDFIVDDESFNLIKQYYKDRKIDIVIDYEHQTLEDVQAPAGGWIKDLTKGEDAIIAKVDWTPKATEYLKNKEYRYLSPVVLTRKSDKKAVILHSVALTNTPAIDGMFPIINSIDIDSFEENESQITGGIKMELQKLIKLLGLPEGSTEEDVLKVINDLATKANTNTEPDTKDKEVKLVANKTICSLLGLDESAKTEDVTARIMSLKNPKDMVPMADFLELKEKIDKNDATDLVMQGMKSGKLTGAQKEWAEEYALKDPKGFSNFIEKAPQIVPFGSIDFEDTKEKNTLGETELKVYKMIGVTEDEVKKFGR